MRVVEGHQVISLMKYGNEFDAKHVAIIQNAMMKNVVSFRKIFKKKKKWMLFSSFHGKTYKYPPAKTC